MESKNLNPENSDNILEKKFEYDIWGQRSDDPNYMCEPQQVFEEDYATKHFKLFVPYVLLNKENKK